ncbi:MAG: acyl carrier protein [Hespellia sp.]|nr:acyl carrier protein [Hespellia sp.]
MENRHMLEKIKGLVAENLNAKAEDITEATKFVDDLGADSLDLVELVMAFEEEFEVSIPEDEVANLVTVGDVVKYVEANK